MSLSNMLLSFRAKLHFSMQVRAWEAHHFSATDRMSSSPMAITNAYELHVESPTARSVNGDLFLYRYP